MVSKRRDRKEEYLIELGESNYKEEINYQSITGGQCHFRIGMIPNLALVVTGSSVQLLLLLVVGSS